MKNRRSLYITLLLLSLLLFLSINVSSQPTACFTYSVDGINVTLTSCSSGVVSNSTYIWNVTYDGVTYSTTGWITGSNGTTYIISVPYGGDVCVLLTVRNNSLDDSYETCISNIEDLRDEFPPEDYRNAKACHEAGYYWYDNECSDCPEPTIWDEMNTLDSYKEAGYHERGVDVFGYSISPTLIIIFGIVLAFSVLLFGVRKRKGEKK